MSEDKSFKSILYSGTATGQRFNFLAASKHDIHQMSSGINIGLVTPGAPLNSFERGAIITPPNSVHKNDDGTVKVENPPFDPDLTRAALLFFDRLDHPRHSFIQIGEECPLGLEDWKGMQRSHLQLSGGLTQNFMPNLMTLVVGEVFEELNKREQGMWAVARGDTQRLLPDNKLSPLSAFKIRIENALPIPARQVSYDEVLSFKTRRRDELMALRHYIDGLALEVSQSGFSEYHQTVAFEKFDKALGDYYKAARPENFLKRLTSLDISYSLSDAIKGALAGASSAATVALPSLEHAAISAAVGLSVGVGFKNKVDRTVPSPFDYVFLAGKEM
jgi:hypothetical protein